MPAALEVLGDALDRLMQLAKNLAVGLPRAGLLVADITRYETIDAAQKSVRPVGARIGPIHLFFRRRGEELEQTARVRAEPVDHFIGADDVAFRFRHFRAV